MDEKMPVKNRRYGDVQVTELGRRVEKLEVALQKQGQIASDIAAAVSVNGDLVRGIASDTKVLRRVLHDGVIAVHFVGQVGKSLRWLARNVAIPLAAVVLIGYWLGSGVAPAWFIKLKLFAA